MAGYIGSKVAVVSSGAERKKVFTATSGQTSFTGLSYTVNNVHVFQNGVRLVDGTDYTATNGNSITLTVGAATDDQVVVVSYNTFQTSDTVSASTGGTFAGDVNFTANFTSRGIDDNATSTAMTLDGSGNLLVGTTDTDPSNDTSGTGGIALGAGSYISLARANSTPLLVNRIGSGTENILFKKDGSTVGSIGSVNSGLNLFISANSGVGMGIGNDNLYPVNASGAATDGSLDIGDSVARFKDLYLSGGVDFGGAVNSGGVVSSSNKLDDYEEGTWTPTLPSGGTIGSIQAAKYVKIGNLVTVNFYIATINPTANTTLFKIGSLPYNAKNSPNSYFAGSIAYSGNAQSNTLLPITGQNYNYIYFHRNDANSATLSNNDMRALGFVGATADDLIMSITYQTN